MLQLSTLEALRNTRTAWANERASVAFVPTMGNLHAGHLRLVEHAKTLADKVIVSIYVNPMQFGANEDLDSYPRTLAADMEKLEQAGAHAVFTPTTEMVYPRGLGEQTFIEVPSIGDVLCGASRPGHFRGVATIVNKLFNMVQPDYAVFGKKDYQQLLVIRLMVADLSLPIEIHGVDTERASDGLALSSRNGYLSPAERQQASSIYQALQHCATTLSQQAQQGGLAVSSAEAACAAQLTAAGFKVDYVSIRRQHDFAPAQPQDTQVVILVAAYMGKTRLIDNLEVSL